MGFCCSHPGQIDSPMGHHTGGNLLHSEKPRGRQVASKLDFSALKGKSRCPAMTHPTTSCAGSWQPQGLELDSTRSTCPSQGCPQGCRAGAEGRRELTRGMAGLRGLLRTGKGVLHTMYTNNLNDCPALPQSVTRQAQMPHASVSSLGRLGKH